MKKSLKQTLIEMELENRNAYLEDMFDITAEYVCCDTHDRPGEQTHPLRKSYSVADDIRCHLALRYRDPYFIVDRWFDSEIPDSDMLLFEYIFFVDDIGAFGLKFPHRLESGDVYQLWYNEYYNQCMAVYIMADGTVAGVSIMAENEKLN